MVFQKGRVLTQDGVDWTAAFQLFPGDVAYCWHASLHGGVVATALRKAGLEIRSQIIWTKQHFALSRGDYHWQHEACWYAVRTGRSSRWMGDRTQTTVWSVPNNNPFGGDATAANAPTGHATQKPVALFEAPLLNHTEPGEAMYDSFAGSGSAVIAAERLGARLLRHGNLAHTCAVHHRSVGSIYRQGGSEGFGGMTWG